MFSFRLLAGQVAFLFVLLVYSLPLHAGISWQQTGGPPGGTVNAIAVDSRTPGTMYAATDAGAFKSTNAGASWQAISSGLSGNDLKVTAIAVDPASSQTIYIGTGGTSVFKSVDGGSSWVYMIQLYYPIKMLSVAPTAPGTLYVGTDAGLYRMDPYGYLTDGFTNKPATALLLHPGNSQLLYVGIYGGGVFRSDDGGTTWTALNGGLTALSVKALVRDPVNSQVLYAGTNAGIFKSVNGGALWSEVSNGLGSKKVTRLAMDPVNGQIVYAGTDSGLFRSANGGNSWSATDNWPLDRQVNVVVTDPVASQTLYAGTPQSLYKSIDGGASWSAATTGLISTSPLTVVDPNDSNTLYAFDLSGVHKSSDAGASWQTRNNGLPLALNGRYVDIQDLAVEPGNSQTLYAATYSNGVYRSTDGGASWSASGSWPAETQVNALLIDPANPQVVYASVFYEPYTIGRGVFKSSDGGSSWTRTSDGLPSSPTLLALAFDPSNSQVLYASSFNGVFKSSNGGSSWSRIDSSPQYYSAIVVDPRNPATLYAAEQGVHKSTDGGVTWNLVNPSRSFVTMDAATGVLYAAGGLDHVSMSADGGATWEELSLGLPLYVNNVSVARDGTVYAGSGGAGVFKLTPANPLPTISGAPPASATTGVRYSFTPTTTNTTHFAITNKPSWASFDHTSGTLFGTPLLPGEFGDIVITAMNTSGQSQLRFSITVTGTVQPAHSYTYTYRGADVDPASVSGSLFSAETAATISFTMPQPLTDICNGNYCDSSWITASLTGSDGTRTGFQPSSGGITGIGSNGLPTSWDFLLKKYADNGEYTGSVLLSSRSTASEGNFLVKDEFSRWDEEPANDHASATTSVSDPTLYWSMTTSTPGKTPRVQLPQTGQSSCWDILGNPLPSCAGTGQDGEKQAGAAWPEPRFEGSDGALPVATPVVVDKLTGLQWVRDARTPSYGACDGGAMSWQSALDYVACLNANGFLGHNDWRLPNVHELASLSNRQLSDSAAWLNSLGFSGVQPTYYWTSTTRAPIPMNALWVHFGDKFTSHSPKSNQHMVLPVRSGLSRKLPATDQVSCWDSYGNQIGCAGTGQDGETRAGISWPVPRMTNPDLSTPVSGPTVYDSLTGLEWVRDPRTPGFLNCSSGPFDWQGSLAYVACLNANNYLGHNDWRLPNAEEYSSLFSRQQFTWTALNAAGFSNFTSGLRFWTSSTYGPSSELAWFAGTTHGVTGIRSKINSTSGETLNYWVLPVRGGVILPGKPTITSVATASGQATISFTPPVANGGAPVTGYTVTAQPGNIVVNGSQSPLIVTGLNNGTRYVFYLAAQSASGAGRMAKISALVSGQAAVNGICGSANGGTFTATPTQNLCSSGSASAVTGSGPITWSCAGSGGGVKANCIAYLTTNTAAPVTTITPAGGSYSTGSVVVTLTSSNTSALIYYTTDGADPRVSPQTYTGPITITGNKTINYFARDAAGNSEPVRSATYSVTAGGPPAASITSRKSGTVFTVLRSEGGGAPTAVVTDSTATTFTDTTPTKPNTVYQYHAVSDTDPSLTVLMTIRTPMYNGWNIIAVPYDTTGLAPTSLFGSSVSAIYEWVPTGATPEGSSSQLGYYTTRSAIAPGKGYFVKASNNSTMLVYAGQAGQPGTVVTLKPGWTMIANPTLTNMTQLGSRWLIDGVPLYAAIISNKIGGSVYWWNGTTYDSWTIMGNNPQIEPWKGYWIVNLDTVDHQLTITGDPALSGE